jgi:hypothetical protein
MVMSLESLTSYWRRSERPAPLRSVARSRGGGVLAAVLAIGVAACVATPAGPTGQDGVPTSGPVSPAITSSTAAPASEPTSPPSVAPGGTATPAPAEAATPAATPTEPPIEPTAPPGLQMDLLAHSENITCTFIPNGALDGSDQLTVFFYFSLLYASPDQLDRLVTVTGSSDSGLATSYSSGVNNQAVSAANFSVRPTDFGVTHQISLHVDSDGYYAETDETNNVASVTVTLPASRPTTVVDPLPCA